MLSELIEQDRKLTLLSYLFLQVGDAWPVDFVGFLSKNGGRTFFTGASTLCELPIPDQASPTVAHVSVPLSILSLQDFLPSLVWSPIKAPRIQWQQLWQLHRSWPQKIQP